jgi:hypothetical protein
MDLSSSNILPDLAAWFDKVLCVWIRRARGESANAEADEGKMNGPEDRLTWSPGSIFMAAWIEQFAHHAVRELRKSRK